MPNGESGSESGFATQAAGSGGQNLPPSSLPWHQIPRFEPGVTDIRTYTRKLQFLRDLWPEQHIAHLAPRAALLVEGAGFQKVSRLDAAKLKTKKGVEMLVEALGGQWGRLEHEDRYDLFERAFYTTQQKTDESNSSYLNRHDVAFEDLVTKDVKLEEVRAYVLLRHSTLSMEDRKKVIMDCAGKLSYEDARKSIRLLGAKFFQEPVGGKTNSKQKMYDVNYADEPEDYTIAYTQEWEPDEESMIQQMLEEEDEDALFLQDFEEQIILACQESMELSSCFTTYQEARSRLRDRAKGRGFWPLKGRGKGKSSGKKGKMTGKDGFGAGMNNMMGRRRSLAHRIANSTCRACGQPGHWRRECPNRPSDQEKEKTAFTGLMMPEDDALQDFDVIYGLPDDAESYDQASVETRIGNPGKSHGL